MPRSPSLVSVKALGVPDLRAGERDHAEVGVDVVEHLPVLQVDLDRSRIDGHELPGVALEVEVGRDGHGVAQHDDRVGHVADPLGPAHHRPRVIEDRVRGPRGAVVSTVHQIHLADDPADHVLAPGERWEPKHASRGQRRVHGRPPHRGVPSLGRRHRSRSGRACPSRPAPATRLLALASSTLLAFEHEPVSASPWAPSLT